MFVASRELHVSTLDESGHIRTYITPAPWKALSDPEFWRSGIGELLPREGTPGTRRVLDRYDIALEFNVSSQL